MRTIRINDLYREVVLAPDDGSDTFLLNVVPHDEGATRAAAKHLSREYRHARAGSAQEVYQDIVAERRRPRSR